MANWSNAKKIEAGEIWTCFEGKKTRSVVILKEEMVSRELGFNLAFKILSFSLNVEKISSKSEYIII